ncbi:MAG: energy-coupling factor transporter ATPase [Eubacteriales bacterium SKADARSKE-1]|nr:energy-coupling factor transporter ATPase [Eubacteriales bacterium SKADARSKE-1]
MTNFIETEDLKFKYSDDVNEKNVLDGISISIKKGEFLTVLGHNASGKSTLAKHFNVLLLPFGGKVFVNGIDTKNESELYEIRRMVGLVLQNPDNQIVASIVEEDVAFGPENLGVKPKEIRERVDEALKSVDMYEHRNSATYKLSGGQKQRLAIAGILAMKPECIVLDEPTAMLDPVGRREVLDTLIKLNHESGITVILITHYMDEAINSDRVIIMNEGSVLLSGKPREVFKEVELLKKYSLDVPQSTELIHRLKLKGCNLPEGILSTDECVQALEHLLEDNKCQY